MMKYDSRSDIPEKYARVLTVYEVFPRPTSMSEISNKGLSSQAKRVISSLW